MVFGGDREGREGRVVVCNGVGEIGWRVGSATFFFVSELRGFLISLLLLAKKEREFWRKLRSG